MTGMSNERPFHETTTGCLCSKKRTKSVSVEASSLPSPTMPNLITVWAASNQQTPIATTRW